MFSSLQPSRPKVHSPQTQNPMHQQQARTASTSSPQGYQAPRNQVEAMPPHQTSINRVTPGPTTQPFNPATQHPVFFSDAWRKAPFPLPGTGGFSPVATGYVFARGAAGRQQPSTKL